MVKKGEVKKFVENPDRKSSKRVKEVASQEPKTAAGGKFAQEAGEKDEIA